MTDRDRCTEVISYLQLRSPPEELAALDGPTALRILELHEQIAALRRIMDKADGGPIAPTVSAVVSVLVQMDREQLGQIARAAVTALELR